MKATPKFQHLGIEKIVKTRQNRGYLIIFTLNGIYFKRNNYYIMVFQSALPCPLLKDVVINYWQAAYPMSNGEALPPPQIPAAVSLHMIFNLKEIFKVRKSNGEVNLVPKCFIRGHLTEPLIMEELKGSEAFCINFKPSAAFRLWGLPVQEFENTPFSLEEVFGKKYEEWIDKVMESKSFPERVIVCESFLLNVLIQNKYNTKLIDYSLELIGETAGVGTVKNLAEQFSLSSRQFDRRFLQQVGISPKVYSSIIRINYIISEIRNCKRIDWQEIIYKYGYFDQAHFIKDFSKQTGVPPTKYFKDLLYDHAQHFIIKP